LCFALATLFRNRTVSDVKRSFTSERGAAIWIAACVTQIEAGVQRTLSSDDLEGPHEVRIGLRKLRAALGLFRPAIDAPRSRELSEQAKWLGQEVGKTRDLEVVLYQIFEPALGNDGDTGRRHPFLRVFRSRADSERGRLRDLLGGERVQQFLAGISAYVTHRGWLLPDDITQTERLAMPLGELARLALRDRWKKTVRKAKHLEHQSVRQSHELRKEMKKLRYSIEFLAPLYPARRVSPFVNRLKALQTDYGDWNDAAIAKRLFEAVIAQDMAELGDLASVVDVIENLQAGAAAKMANAARHWHKLQLSDKPWA
jgi:triphosphatase